MKKINLMIICLLLAVGCIDAEVKMIPLHIGKIKFTVEIADTPEKQTRGMMFRKDVPDDFGMLFPYQSEGFHSFWMKNCFVHLDIIYLNRYKQIVDIYFNVPPCEKEPCESYPNREPAQYVLELKGNRAKELNLKIGDTVFFILD